MAVGSAISGMHTQIQMATAIGGESMGRLIDADAIEHCLVIGGRRHGKTIINTQKTCLIGLITLI